MQLLMGNAFDVRVCLLICWLESSCPSSRHQLVSSPADCPQSADLSGFQLVQCLLVVLIQHTQLTLGRMEPLASFLQLPGSQAALPATDLKHLPQQQKSPLSAHT
jgi:hypothetical protein